MTDQPARWTYVTGEAVGLPGTVVFYDGGREATNDEVLAALNAPMSPEAQAVIDAAVEWTQALRGQYTGGYGQAVFEAADAYEASLDPEAPTGG